MSKLPDGTQRFEVRAIDAAGNRSAVASQVWNVYTGPPFPTFSTAPGLAVGFDRGIRDNVVRCNGQPVTVRVAAPPGWKASVAGGGFAMGVRSVRVPVTSNRRFTVTFQADSGGPPEVFSVRCLPSDFPSWRFVRQRSGGPDFFMIQYTNRYAVIHDRNGVPVWWHKATGIPDNVELLADGTLAWAPVQLAADQVGRYEVHGLDGRLLRTVTAKNNLPTDIHELLRLNSGNYLLAGQTRETGVDLTGIGGPASGTVIGFEMQEVTPQGALASTWWRSQGHISPEETPPRWRNVAALPDGSYDTQHWNSIQPTDNNTKMLLSFRHLDAVYKVDRATGDVEWKLGGTTTPQSLSVQNDPLGSDPLSGQHDARLQPDGTVSIFDNGTAVPRRPRVVRYRIDPQAGTATYVQSFIDPDVTGAFCCGSARLVSNSWLVGWGGQASGDGVVGSYDLAGRRIWKLVTPGSASYRANPVPPGALNGAQLRAAMDAAYR